MPQQTDRLMGQCVVKIAISAYNGLTVISSSSPPLRMYWQGQIVSGNSSATAGLHATKTNTGNKKNVNKAKKIPGKQNTTTAVEAYPNRLIVMRLLR